MISSPLNNDVQRIIVLNPKGGCGKSTIATNLASYYALRGPLPTLVDCDPHGFSLRWLERRSDMRPSIYGIEAFKNAVPQTRTWQLRVPEQSRRVIIDSPAGLEVSQIHDLVYDATHIIIPVLPSPIDIRFATRFIAEMLLLTQLDRGQVKVGIVANRTRKNTKSLRQLMRFLNSLRIPVIATLRDSQAFVEAVGRGIGICELRNSANRKDIGEFLRLVGWLDRWPNGRQVVDGVTTTTGMREIESRQIY